MRSTRARSTFSVGAGASPKRKRQRVAARPPGSRIFTRFRCRRLLDLATAPLLAAVARGSHIATGTLTIVRTGAAPETFLVLNMKDIAIASVNMAESQTENRPTETIALIFGQIDFEYTEFLPNGAKGATNSFRWNITTNQPT
jgi:type VI protein secretion system component Hcp